MSFKAKILYPCAPSTARSVSTKLGESNGRIVYTNGKTVIVRAVPTARPDH